VKNAIIFALVPFAAFVLLLSGGAATREHGEDGRYFSPLGNFSVPIPDGPGLRVQEQDTTDSGSVAFHDDLGNFKGIFYLNLSPETPKAENDPIQQRVILVSFLNDFAIPNLFKAAYPRASILHREHLDTGDFNAYFAVVEIPEGSTMADVKANKRYDTRRGLLIFVEGEFIYMLSSGENPSVPELGEPAKPLDKLVEHEKERLLSFRSTIVFK